jgi:hypothetical protein
MSRLSPIRALDGPGGQVGILEHSRIVSIIATEVRSLLLSSGIEKRGLLSSIAVAVNGISGCAGCVKIRNSRRYAPKLYIKASNQEEAEGVFLV